jgi:hypothetical protein
MEMPMKAVAGVFRSQVDAKRAFAVVLQSTGTTDKMILLTPGDIRQNGEWVPVLAGTQTGVRAADEPTGATARRSFAAVIPGVGVITAIGTLGAAVLRAAGAAVEAETNLEHASTEGLPEDEIFVYEDALRKGGSVLIIMADENVAGDLQGLLQSNGASSIDDARHQWWLGLRGLELEHYSEPNRNFAEDETFYRLGFEAALHSRTRCMEYDQVYGEMTAKLEEVQQQYPNASVEEPFTRGYERGRDYYQALCDQSRAA